VDREQWLEQGSLGLSFFKMERKVLQVTKHCSSENVKKQSTCRNMAETVRSDHHLTVEKTAKELHVNREILEFAGLRRLCQNVAPKFRSKHKMKSKYTSTTTTNHCCVTSQKNKYLIDTVA